MIECMSKKFYNNDLVLHVVLLLLCLIPVLLSFVLATNGNTTSLRFPAPVQEFGTACVFKIATGYNCPACGMTRCFVYMSSLNVAAAWSMNKAGVLLYFFCIMQLPYRLLMIIGTNIFRQKYMIVFQAVFLVAIGIVDLLEFIKQFIRFV